MKINHDKSLSFDRTCRSKMLFLVTFASVGLLLLVREANAEWFLFGRPQRKYEQCVELYDTKQFQEARACIRNFLESYPNSRWIEHLQFLDAKLATDVFKARIKMHSFVQEFPEGPYSAEANYSLGELAELTADYTEAQRFYMRVYEYFPTSELNDKAALQAAKTMLLSGSAESAASHLGAYLADKPQQPWLSRARQLYADALFDAGDFQMAQKVYKQIVSDAPLPQDASPESYLKIAGIYEVMGNYDAALQAYSRFLSIFPDATQKAAVERKMASLASHLKVNLSINGRPHIIEAGLFESRHSAMGLIARLRMLGYQAYTVTRNIDRAEFVSVRLGPYDSKESALAAADRLNEEAGLNVTILPHGGMF
jgi:TolA-binding protein